MQCNILSSPNGQMAQQAKDTFIRNIIIGIWRPLAYDRKNQAIIACTELGVLDPIIIIKYRNFYLYTPPHSGCKYILGKKLSSYWIYVSSTRKSCLCFLRHKRLKNKDRVPNSTTCCVRSLSLREPHRPEIILL